MTEFFATTTKAVDALRTLISEMTAKPADFHHQGDEVGDPVDFFSPAHPPDRLHPSFQTLMAADQFSPARGIIGPMMRWHEDLDGNFVEQFQSTAFDQRIWELYLFATLTELGYVLDREHHVPDFIAGGLLGQMTIEAVTVGPTRDGAVVVPPPPTDTVEQARAYLSDYMPIKYGSSLFTKLRKEYWKRPQIDGLPLVFAIADFSSPGPMKHTGSALERYLYGYSWETIIDEDGKAVSKTNKISEHRWGEKVIPSGFFDLPDAENISAVIFSNAGTIAKFNRIGLLSGFGAKDILMIREGACINNGPGTAPNLFRSLVNAVDYRETWVEGLDVFHNPRAKLPLPKRMFPGAAHHWCDAEGGRAISAPDFHPLGSITRVTTGVDVSKALNKYNGAAVQLWIDAVAG
ncbi:hypothetical protein AB9E29_07060 [Rhizobium leguminosarum]|uniref:hypothetical protein n=1 Tax=Rhizobium leguminosarum TaxID=384 RepID=UPI003F9A8525